ncbi:MAG: bifunctional protein HldE [Phycisphaerae bacterium]|nr:MAG: bifunctional protein HldE [Phycisphaerae bacterium]
MSSGGQRPPARDPRPPRAKVLDRHDLLALRARLRAQGRALVHCHGCFDVIHPGHVRHLRQAKALGDTLLVSITGDTSIRKGPGRPLVPQDLRAESLAELDCVDAVFIDDHPTATPLLAALQPDFYVKGREYERNDDPRFADERRAVEAAGGRVVFTSGDIVFSSSALIAALEDGVDPFHARLAALAARPDLAPDTFAALLASIRGRRVVVVGEVIRDTYILCDRPDVAAESPVLSLRPLEVRQYDGGAAAVARHAAALGARVTLVSALPHADDALALRDRLAHEGIDLRAVTIASPIPEKQRFLVGTQKVMKLDLVERPVLDQSQHDDLRRLAREAACESDPSDPLDPRPDRAAGLADAAIIADFGLGLFSPRALSDLAASLRPAARILAGDVSGRRANLTSLRHADLLCPTEAELRDALRLHDESLPMAAWRLLEDSNARAAFITLGPDGLIAFLPRHDADPADPQWRQRLAGEHIPALGPLALDPLGCGDALLTTAALALASGASHLQAAYLGAAAAATHAQHLGNPALDPHALRALLTRLHASTLAYAGPLIETRPARRIGLSA